MDLVAAPGAAEVDLVVATAWGIAGRSIRSGFILWTEALHAAPRFDQRAVHREVLVRQQPIHLRTRQHRRQEACGDLAVQQPLAILREGRRVPYWSSMPSPTNQRNDRSKSRCSIICRSERMPRQHLGTYINVSDGADAGVTRAWCALCRRDGTVLEPDRKLS